MNAATAPSRRQRLLAALLVGGAWTLYAARYFPRAGKQAVDFTAIWLAARAALAGLEPYGAVLAWERAFGYENQLGLYYPFPAAVLGLPFAWMDAETAGIALIAASFTLGAYAVTRDRWAPLAAFLGPAAYRTVEFGQLGALLLAAMFMPRALGWMVSLKPTVGAAAWAWRPSRGAVAGSLLLLAASLALEPTWPRQWLATVAGSPWAMVPLAHAWFAPLLLLAVLRWRTPEGRLLLALSCVPHTLFWCDEMILGAALRTRREAVYVTLAGWIGLLAFLNIEVHLLNPGRPLQWERGIPWSIAALYLPVLVVLLLRRENVGDVPAVVERWMERVPLPGWLRGRAARSAPGLAAAGTRAP